MKLQNKRLLFLIIFLGVFVRISFMIYFCDFEKDDYSEYGSIANNIISGKGYSLFYFQNDSIQFKHKTFAKPYPSAFMPPGYVYYLLPFIKIDNVQLRNILFLVLKLFSVQY
jgi:hypothetical protein